MRRSTPSGCRPFRARWKGGCGLKAFAADMTTRRWLMVALVTAAVLLLAGRELAAVYSDYLWFDSLGAEKLWAARISAQATLRIVSAVLAGLFAFANLYAVRQSVVS